MRDRFSFAARTAAVVLATSATLTLTGCGNKGAAQVAPPAPQVDVAQVVLRKITEFDVTDLQQANVNVEAARAAPDTATLNLTFTRVTTPISGHTTRALVTRSQSHKAKLALYSDRASSN